MNSQKFHQILGYFLSLVIGFGLWAVSIAPVFAMTTINNILLTQTFLIKFFGMQASDTQIYATATLVIQI